MEYSDWLSNNAGSLFALGLGGLLGSQASGGSQQAGTTTTSTSPWISQQPYLLDLFSQAKNLYGTSKGVSPEMQSAYSGMQNSLNPALTNQASTAIGNTISGQNQNPYAGSNPYLEGVVNKSLGDVSTRVNSQFGGSNYGTTAHQETLGRALGDQSNALRFQDYATQANLAEQGLNRQMNAAFNVPQFQAANMNGQNNLFNAANIMNNAQWAPLQNYGSAISGSFGGQQSSPYYTNPWLGAAGGAAAGASIYGNIFGNKG